MDISRMLDVAIGLFFVFLLFSILASWIQECIAALLETRSKDLVRTVERLFDPSLEKTKGVKKLEETFEEGSKTSEKLQQNVVKAVYDHPLIQGLSRSPKKQPSYIAAKDFSAAAVDLFVKAGTEQASSADKGIDRARKGIEQLTDTPGKEALKLMADRAEAMSDDAEKQVAAFRESVESWYDSTMERAIGWYKRKMQVWALVTGMVIAIAFNADTLYLVQSLWNDSALRTALAAQAGQQASDSSELTPDAAMAKLEALPVGWQNAKNRLADKDTAAVALTVLLWLVGIALTGAAVSAGSPFWFDVLNQVVNVRSAGGKPASSTTGKPQPQRGAWQGTA